MRSVLLSAAAFLAIAGSASADLTSTRDLGWKVYNRVTGAVTNGVEPTGRAVADGYRDFANPPSVLNGVTTTGVNRRDGDDITMVPNGGNWLDDMGFSIANQNQTAGQFFTAERDTFTF